MNLHNQRTIVKSHAYLCGLKFDAGYEAIRDILDKKSALSKLGNFTNSKPHLIDIRPENFDDFHNKILCDKNMIYKLLRKAKSGLRGISRILPSCKITTEENIINYQRHNRSKLVKTSEPALRSQSPGKQIKKPYYIVTKTEAKYNFPSHSRSISSDSSRNVLIMSGMSLRTHL